MRYIRGFVAIAAVLMLGACATALTPRGNNVRVVDSQSTHNCTFVGTVTGSNTMGNTMADDAEGALNEMRNKAAEMGANAIRVLNVNSRMAGTAASAEALTCRF